MPSMTVKGVPDAVLARLKREAVEHRRSLNGEVLYRLERSLQQKNEEVERWLEEVRELRERIGLRTTTAEIIAARDEGRR